MTAQATRSPTPPTASTATNLWDTTSGLSQLVDDGSSSYVQADGAQETVDSGNTASYPLTDALGSDHGHHRQLRRAHRHAPSYDAFGAVRSRTGTSLSLGFTGELTDPSTGFVDLRAVNSIRRWAASSRRTRATECPRLPGL